MVWPAPELGEATTAAVTAPGIQPKQLFSGFLYGDFHRLLWTQTIPPEW